MLPTGSDDKLWQKIASGIWPQSTLRLSPYYQTYQVLLSLVESEKSVPNRELLTTGGHTLQDMCKGNNACSAWPVMDLAGLGKCSTWKYNLPHSFYQCRLFALQYDTKFNMRHASAKITVFLFDVHVQGCLAMIPLCTSRRLGISQCNTYVYTAAA